MTVNLKWWLGVDDVVKWFHYFLESKSWCIKKYEGEVLGSIIVLKVKMISCREQGINW